MRKQPQQARSRASVEAILEAGARVLGRGGWAAFTTNAVADVAGVSIGTVYQYFPNKVVLADAIRQRHYDEVLRAVEGTGDETRSLGARIERLVEQLAAAHRGAPGLHRALLEDAPKRKGGDEDSAFERAYRAAFERLIVSGPRRRSCPDVEVAASVLAAAVEGAIHDAARRGVLSSRSVQSELVSLLGSYVGATRRRAHVQ